MDDYPCKTCKGMGSIEFECGAVVKPCLTCRGSGRDVYAERDALLVRLAQLEQQTQWISVEERLPEQFEYVVAARMYGHGIEPDMYVSMFVSGRFTVCDDALDASNYDGGACITAKIEVTHWLPLPAASGVSGKEGE